MVVLESAERTERNQMLGSAEILVNLVNLVSLVNLVNLVNLAGSWTWHQDLSFVVAADEFAHDVGDELVSSDPFGLCQLHPCSGQFGQFA